MAETTTDKEITLAPSWKHHFTGYMLSILCIPLFGIGLIALYFVYKKHKSVNYRVTDTQITSTDTRYQRNIDLINIEDVSVRQSWLQQKLGIGTLVLKTSAGSMDILGMEQPQQLKTMIEKAIAVQKNQQNKKQFRKNPEPKYKPGAMEKMDYLTGLWQQGLISDDDFEDERKHFE